MLVRVEDLQEAKGTTMRLDSWLRDLFSTPQVKQLPKEELPMAAYFPVCRGPPGFRLESAINPDTPTCLNQAIYKGCLYSLSHIPSLSCVWLSGKSSGHEVLAFRFGVQRSRLGLDLDFIAEEMGTGSSPSSIAWKSTQLGR